MQEVTWKDIDLNQYSVHRKICFEDLVTPIRRSLEYTSIGRKLLWLDEMPIGRYLDAADRALIAWENYGVNK